MVFSLTETDFQNNRLRGISLICYGFAPTYTHMLVHNFMGDVKKNIFFWKCSYVKFVLASKCGHRVV